MFILFKIGFLSKKYWETGVIKSSDSYIKIMEVIPINFNLKSELEKEAILNSYKIFLKTCNFDLQILIQSNKENLEKHINSINKQKNNENEKIKNVANNYIKYIEELNQSKKSSNKNFYIIVKNPIENERTRESIIEELNEKYFKIKECLARCGNIVKDINEKDKTKEIILSFINRRLYLLN